MHLNGGVFLSRGGKPRRGGVGDAGEAAMPVAWKGVVADHSQKAGSSPKRQPSPAQPRHLPASSFPLSCGLSSPLSARAGCPPACPSPRAALPATSPGVPLGRLRGDPKRAPGGICTPSTQPAPSTCRKEASADAPTGAVRSSEKGSSAGACSQRCGSAQQPSPIPPA